MRFEFCCAALAAGYHLNHCSRSRCHGCRSLREAVRRRMAALPPWFRRNGAVITQRPQLN